MTGIHLYAQVSSCAAAQRQHRLSAPQIPLQHSELLVQEISPALQVQTNTLEPMSVQSEDGGNSSGLQRREPFSLHRAKAP